MLSVSISIKVVLSALFSFVFLCNIAGFEIKAGKGIAVLFSLLLISSSALSGFVQDYETVVVLNEILTVTAFCITPYFCLKRKKRTTFLFFGLSANAVIDFISLAVCYLAKTESINIQNLVFIAVTIVLLLVLFVVYKKYGTVTVSETFSKIPKSIYIVIFLLTQSAYYFWMISVDNQFDIKTASVLLIVSVVALIISLTALIFRFVRAENNKMLSKMQIQVQTENYEKLLISNREIRKFRHDYSNFMISLYSLIDAGKNEEALDFIKRMNRNIEKSSDTYSTGNFMADAIISHLASGAKEFGIGIVFSGSLPADKISNNDITGILSNSITNAIDGCKGCEKPIITIISREHEDGVVITVENPVNKDVVIRDNHVVTTKQDKTNHGFGLENISDIVNKYNGFISLKSENKTFIIKIGLRF